MPEDDQESGDCFESLSSHFQIQELVYSLTMSGQESPHSIILRTMSLQEWRRRFRDGAKTI